MAFKRKTEYSTEQRCGICRKKITQGKEIELYGDFLPCVCDECYGTYFKRIEKIETDSAVRYRPATIHADRYMLKNVFKSMLWKDIILHPIIGAALWLLCLLTARSFPTSLIIEKPLYMQISLTLYSVFTVPGIINSIRLLVGGCLRGMDNGRRVLLAIKIIVYIICCAAALIYSSI